MATTEYIPVARVVAGFIIGFCKVELKPLGPIQLYVEPAVVVAVRSNALPEHIGELLPNVGGGGVGLMVTVIVAEFLHIPNITVTV